MFSKINLYSDGFLSYAAAFILSYAVFTYNRLGVFKSLTLSLIVGFFAATTVYAVKYFYGEKSGYKARRKKLAEALNLTLAFYSDEKLLNLFLGLLEKQNFTAAKKKRFLEITELNAAFYPVFKYDSVTPQELIDAYKNCGYKKLIVAANGYVKDCFNLAAKRNGQFVLFDGQDVFLSLEKFNLLPDMNLCDSKKRTLKTFAFEVFKKENFKKLLILGLIVISLSVISSKPLFFIISGAAISLSAVAAKLFAPNGEKPIKGINLPPRTIPQNRPNSENRADIS